ncbi:uncharacterized protein LOC110041738 [Orbicella faveolata]|uniref:uncharacterized protein LOC110041738 n=1 Tax=Orbicella faveolata TaxID=48498 RepID=UPI0009E37E0E|nr:uncharacterized protein LOC110041738 [Orbicella faveolata]
MIPDSRVIPVEVKALVFDCDGTLVDTMPIHWKAWCKICKETGLVFHKTDFYTLAGVPGKKIINVLAKQQGIKLDPYAIYDRKRKYFLEGLTSVSAIQCVVRIAEEAHRLGIPIAVASGSSRSQVQKALRLAGIEDLFDVVLGNEDYKEHKPKPDAFITAASRLGVNPGDCWGFEDTDIGLEAIRQAGFYRVTDVRQMEGYPMRTDENGLEITNHKTEFHSLRYRAFTM